MFSILGFITGLAGPLANIANKIIDLQTLKAQTASNEELARINRDLEEAHDRRAVLIAEAGNRVAGVINSSVRLVLTLGPAAVLLKLLLWDKVIGSLNGCVGEAGNAARCLIYNTDKLDPYQWGVITAVIAFYFAYDMAKSRK